MTTKPVNMTDSTPATSPEIADEPVLPTASADPVVAGEVAHPVGVGVGMVSAGAAGAAIGAAAGPIGMVIGAAVGAVAGGIVGGEVATLADEVEPGNADSSYTLPDLAEPRSVWTEPPSGGMASEPSSGSLLSGADGGASLATAASPNLAGTGSFGGEVTDIPEDEDYPEEEIRTLAYYRYLDREASGREGGELGDWLEAEREVLPS